GADIALERHVERIEPHDRFGPLMDMLMPGPRRREDEIALLHRTSLAIDDRGRARALEYETQGIHRMAVRSRLLARKQNLDVGRRRPLGLLIVLMFSYGRDELQHPPF